MFGAVHAGTAYIQTTSLVMFTMFARCRPYSLTTVNGREPKNTNPEYVFRSSISLQELRNWADKNGHRLKMAPALNTDALPGVRRDFEHRSTELT